MKKALVLGATGCIGEYLVPELAKKGYMVDGVALYPKEDTEYVRYLKVDGLDIDVIRDLVTKTHYDTVIDLMLYIGLETFKKRYEIFLKNTDHYVFFSSYRVYADSETPIKEESDRLYDVVSDPDFIKDCDIEYALYKAQQEDLLRSSPFENFTILRPTMVYASRRYQLVGLEAPVFLKRAAQGKKVILPECARNICAALIWSGDAAKLISGIVNNQKAFGETYTICNGEKNTWEDIAKLYKEYANLDYEFIDTNVYMSLFKEDLPEYRKHIYDRFFNRITDPAKILEATGFKKENFTFLKDGLKKELATIPKDFLWWEHPLDKKMDELIENNR
ncbi:MAG: NAD-dependent epimerase/dehydratase family protein [Ruminococcaceae bacterium]|nr:NAD-dependent epimerase/dehydratase family protein [Oscillospiraceae bacterium]